MTANQHLYMFREPLAALRYDGANGKAVGDLLCGDGRGSFGNSTGVFRIWGDGPDLEVNVSD